MADAILRREIKRLVEEQKVLNQRLQRKPPAAAGPRPDANKDKGDNAEDGGAAGQQKRPAVRHKQQQQQQQQQQLLLLQQ
ncbi:pinin/SDK/memA/ domain-containing protein, putative [Eimeria mitis]|uniref:Pinin/SDK/memA/ domain-containing protein, putative n=1 Tax=Eimeria mitis TaxID=44415 RepID=U6KKC5_9EIME|nr:pinin/SDK/memA/ domain-containing protein, putative [Eimeria mitis]CDJ35888.1 pinin/SDK/memA/ domain-containing protein, putative [Eimeria mitis]